MAYFLDTYVGSGTKQDPFRPSIFDADPLADAIDLRVPGSISGLAVVRSDIAKPKAAQIKVADDAKTKSKSLVSAIQSKFGLTLSTSSLDFATVLTELFINHSRTDGHGWNPLQPSYRPESPTLKVALEIWLGEKLVEIPYISGGGIFQDNFTRSNSTTVGNNWVETVGDWEILSNQLHLVTNGGAVGNYIKWDNNFVGSVNMYMQAVLAGSTNYSEAYVLARYSSASQTFYFHVIFNDGSAPGGTARDIRKSISGSESRLSSQITTQSHTNGDLIDLLCNGSTLTSYKNGVQVNTVTDTSIATGTLGGLGGYNNTIIWDTAEVGDYRQGRVQSRISGSMTAKPIARRTGGVFVVKPMYAKVAGAWREMN